MAILELGGNGLEIDEANREKSSEAVAAPETPRDRAVALTEQARDHVAKVGQLWTRYQELKKTNETDHPVEVNELSREAAIRTAESKAKRLKSLGDVRTLRNEANPGPASEATMKAEEAIASEATKLGAKPEEMHKTGGTALT
ncbi:MAG: hypothetical protein NTW50_00370 [Candidatus Berkelbacteria bacterium]|nr:hypothetical protein [Candidatus Berkelbacteria bacterium]